MIQGGGEFRIDQCHIPVGSGIGAAVFETVKITLQGLDQFFVDVFATLLPGNQTAQIVAQTINAAGMEPGLCFAHREYNDLIHVFGAALGVRVKETHGIQLVAKELSTEGVIGGRGEHIQNTAAKGELTGAFHHRAAAVSGCSELLQKPVNGILPAHPQTES